MLQNIAATKSNLTNAQKSLKLSIEGYDLLDKKRNVLIRELMKYVGRSKMLREKTNLIFKAAYKALQTANITLGISTVSDIALAIPLTHDYEVLFKSVMGVEVPNLKYEKKPITPMFSFHDSNESIDSAFEKFNEVKYLIFELAEVQNAVYRLAIEIKKTQRKANALENIQIPEYRAIVKLISDELEEKDREDFVRIKVVKTKKNKKKIEEKLKAKENEKKIN